MKRLLIVLSFFTICFCNHVWSQNLYYLHEGFETSASSSRWVDSPQKTGKQWQQSEGGLYVFGGNHYNPELPYQGTYDEGLYFQSVNNLDSIKLISPTIQLAGSGKPTLRFYHCQYASPNGPDHLRLLFRNGPHENWDLIHEWTSDISTWQGEIFDISSINPKYLTDTFQIAFEGVVGNGYGVYIDSVTVHEDTILPMFVKKTSFTSVNYKIIPAGATNIPLEQIEIEALGNTGKATLDSICLIPSGTGVDYTVTDSFKLYCTNSNNVFAPFVADTSTLIATASLSSGKVIFNNLNHDLTLGNNYFWVVASFKNTIRKQVNLQFSIPKDGIRVSDTLLPSSTVTFDKNHVIKETAYYDDFDSGSSGWTLDSNFEVGFPGGNLVSTQTNPSSPFNGHNILATDLDGGYLPNIDSATAYYAYTPELNLKYYINPGVYYESLTNINGSDHAAIDYSLDSGATWHNLWKSDPSSNNADWTEIYNTTLNKIASRQPHFQIRFGIDSTQNVPWPGFGIDNFAIIAEKLYKDVSVVKVLDPVNQCRNCGNDTVKAWIRNYAINAAPDTIPVYYGLWGTDSTIVRDTIFGGINKDDSVLFSFSKLANFPKGDYYNKFVVGCDLPGDQDPTNDTLTRSLIIQNYYTPPILENFEYKGGIWLPSEGSSWKNKDMTGTITTDPKSPHIWVLSPSGNYMNNDTSYVESGCYNLSGDTRNILQFKYWSDCEAYKDGARFEYSIDDGATWKFLQDPVYDTLWNWTIDTVKALGSPGWSGTNNWTTAKALLPIEADTAKKVKFRLLFMSDSANSQAQGFAFNDFQLYPAPADIGASSILSPEDACQFINSDTVKVYVTNYGYNKLNVNDTVIVGVDLIGQVSAIDTFKLTQELLPGDSALFNVYTPMNIDTPGTYNLRAYTLIEKDPWLYGKNNDTTTKSFTVWPDPYTMLPDTISSRRPDTVVIKPYYNANYSFMWGYKTNNSLSTDSVYHVSIPGTYRLTVTENTHGCQSHDSSFVQLLFNDVGVDSILSPVSACELSNSEHVTVRVRNFGTDSLIAGDKIWFDYQLNNGTIKKDSVTLTRSFHSKEVMPLTFTTSEDLSGIGNYTIVSWANCGGDTIPQDDTAQSSFKVYGYPHINLGNDTVVKALSFPLSVSPIYASYHWNDGDTTNSKLVENSGKYKLDVVDTNGCSTSDSINIWLKIRDISAMAMLSPVSACNRQGSDKVTMEIKNNGTDTLTSSDSIHFSYILNNLDSVTENLGIAELKPGDTYQYTFNKSVDLTSPGTYGFQLSANTAGDLRPNDNVIDSSVYTNSTPVVHLNVDPNTVYKTTEKVLDAGSGQNYAYLWQDGSTNETYTVTDNTLVKVLVTDTLTGCYGGDTVLVNLDILDYTITSVGINQTSCSGIYNNVTVGILNNGNLARASADIMLTYKLDSATLFTEEFQENRNWLKGATRTYQTVSPIDLSTVGTRNLKVTATADGDLRPENNTYSKTIDVIPSPTIDLGGDTIQVKVPHTLDAGAGDKSYLWSDNSTNETFTVNEAGNYSVTVTGNNGCIASRSVHVTVGTSISQVAADEMKVNIFPNPAQDYITVDTKFEHPGDYTIEIRNSLNNLIYTKKITGANYTGQIYVGNLSPGIYFIRISNKEMYHISKLVIR